MKTFALRSLNPRLRNNYNRKYYDNNIIKRNNDCYQMMKSRPYRHHVIITSVIRNMHNDRRSNSYNINSNDTINYNDDNNSKNIRKQRKSRESHVFDIDLLFNDKNKRYNNHKNNSGNKMDTTEEKERKKSAISTDQLRLYLDKFGINSEGSDDTVLERAMVFRSLSSVPNIDKIRAEMNDNNDDINRNRDKNTKFNNNRNRYDDYKNGGTDADNKKRNENERRRRRKLKQIESFMTTASHFVNFKNTLHNNNNIDDNNAIVSHMINLETLGLSHGLTKSQIEATLSPSEIERALEYRKKSIEKMIDRVEKSMIREAEEERKR